MLSGLLRALAEPRVPSMPELASRTGTDLAGLRRALEQCERLGYLERTEVPCDLRGCAACPIAEGCHPAVAARRDLPVGPSWWRLTERGARAIRMAPVAANRAS